MFKEKYFLNVYKYIFDIKVRIYLFTVA